jgi:hypothetical protein
MLSRLCAGLDVDGSRLGFLLFCAPMVPLVGHSLWTAGVLTDLAGAVVQL